MTRAILQLTLSVVVLLLVVPWVAGLYVNYWRSVYEPLTRPGRTPREVEPL